MTARNKAGLTQAAVAKELGISEGSVSYWENKNCIPSGKNAEQIVKLYGIDPKEYRIARKGSIAPNRYLKNRKNVPYTATFTRAMGIPGSARKMRFLQPIEARVASEAREKCITALADVLERHYRDAIVKRGKTEIIVKTGDYILYHVYGLKVARAE